MGYNYIVEYVLGPYILCVQYTIKLYVCVMRCCCAELNKTRSGLPTVGGIAKVLTL